MKKKVFVFGGARFHGYDLVCRLTKDKENEVYVLNRGNNIINYNPEINHIKIDRNDQENFEKVLKEIKPEAIYDNNAYNHFQIKNLIDIIDRNKEIKNELKHYIFTSSIAVYKRLTDNHLVKEKESKNEIKSEIDPKIIDYANNKLLAENYIIENFKEIPFTILRFPNIFGEGDFAKKLSFFEKKIKKDKVLYLEEEINNFSIIYYKDSSKIMEESILNNSCFNQIINCADSLKYSYNKFFDPIFNDDYHNCRIKLRPAISLFNTENSLPFAWGPALDTTLFKKVFTNFKFNSINYWGKKSLIGEKIINRK